MATGRAKVVGVDTASTADDAAAADDAATAEPVLVEVVEPFQINDGTGNVYGPGETALLPADLAERFIATGWCRPA